MGNGALKANPPTGVDITITTHGSDWYWTVTAIMTVATIAFLAMSAMQPRTRRIFHYITASITLVAAIAYFTMASNLGWTPIDVEFQRSNRHVAGINRSIFYVRYIDWFITTPLLLLDLLLTAGLPWPTILFTLLMDEVMIVTGLVGALVHSSYKWGYYVFGCLAFLAVVWTVGWTARKHAFALGADVHRTFIQCGVLTLFLWFLYPIAWGLCEGGNVISPDSEAIFYGILDVFAKPVFGILLLLGHRNIDPARLGLSIRDYDEDPAATGGLRSGAYNEKRGVTNGAGTTGTATTGGVTDATMSTATGADTGTHATGHHTGLGTAHNNNTAAV